MTPPLQPYEGSLHDEILVTQTRHSLDGKQSLVENRHWGWVAWSDATGRHGGHSLGANIVSTFIRSAAKPFQALPLLSTGAAQDLSPEMLAICCASHTGTERHLQVVEQLLQRSGLTQQALQCGADWPVDPARRRALRQAGEAASPLYHNCSGKHAGMLFCCRQNGWSIETYLEPEHPLQRSIVVHLSKLSGLKGIPMAVDGCGAPVFYLPLSAMARLYALLAGDPELAPLRNAMAAQPELVGGPGRVDTGIMQASAGRLVAKVGADGVLCVADTDQKQGLALKIADGSAEIRNFALLEILVSLGWLSKHEANDSILAKHREARRFNSQGKVIGEVRLHLNR
jgi:L-asparaginase